MENNPGFMHTAVITTGDERECLSTTKIRLFKCRLCSHLCDRGVLVFSDEGRRKCLQGHIKKYLYITITMDDKLTKLICTNCCKILENFHNFATMVAQSQCQLLRQAGHITFFMEHQDKGLLHAYLTKGDFINDHDYATNKNTKTGKTSRKPRKRRRNNKTIEVNIQKDINIENTINHISSLPIVSEANKTSKNKSKTEVELEENHTLDSNTHETLEVDLDPLIFLDSSCSYDEVKTSAKDFDQETKHNQHILCNSCDFSFDNITIENCNDNYLSCNNNNNNNNDHEDIDQCYTKEEIDSYEMKTNDNKGEIDKYDKKKEKCPFCEKSGFTQDSLQLHLRIHRPKGKHECDICKRIFKSVSSLTQHKLSHNRLQFQCEICHRVYPTKSTLKAHSITHSDLRPHKCQLCDKSFKRNQDLKFHMNQHTGARPYKCIYCPKAFASSGNCFSHRKRMHPHEVERDRNFIAKIL